MEVSSVKFLIAGLGSIGRRHLRNLIAHGEDDILLLRSHQSTLPDEELEGLPVESDLQAALARSPDAVLVCNPTALHLDVALPAARAGSHLLLEKPLSHTMDGVPELVEVVRANDSRVLVGFQFRYHPALRAIQTWIATGAIGAPVSVRAHWGEYLPDWHPWEDYRQSYAARPELGGGVLLTLCHPIDYLRMLFGEAEVISCAASRRGLGLEVEDTVELALQFENGALGSVHLNYVQRPPSHTLQIVGTGGSIVWDNADGVAHLYRSGEGEWVSAGPADGFERNDLFMDEMANFLAMLRGSEAPRCSLEDGIAALQICLQARSRI